MKKKQPKPLSPSILAAQERNRREYEERRNKAVLRIIYNRILMQLHTMLVSFHYGVVGGGIIDNRFPFLNYEMEDTKLKTYLKLPIGKCKKKFDVISAPAMELKNQCQKKEMRENFEAAKTNQAILDTVCYAFVPYLTLYKIMKYELAIMLNLFLDFEEIANRYDEEISDEANDFIGSLILLVNQLFKNSNPKEQKTLTACYWLVWEQFMQLPITEHPNNFNNILIPTFEKDILFFPATQNYPKPLFIRLPDYTEKNKERMIAETERGLDDLKERGIINISNRDKIIEAVI